MIKCKICDLEIQDHESVRFVGDHEAHIEYRCIFLLKHRIEFLEREIKLALALT